MNNIFRVRKKRLALIKQELSHDKKAYIAEIDGKQIHNIEDYCEYMGKAFLIPKDVYYQTYSSLQSCYEWMTNLYWLTEMGYEKIVLMIHNYPSMLRFYPGAKRAALEMLEACINTEETGEKYPDKALPFNIYLETPIAFV